MSVHSWPDAATFSSGEVADRIFGQPDATSTTANNGGLDAGSQVHGSAGTPGAVGTLAEQTQGPQAFGRTSLVDGPGEQPGDRGTAAESEDEDAVIGLVDANDIEVRALDDARRAQPRSPADELAELAVLHLVADAVVVEADLLVLVAAADVGIQQCVLPF